jgi:hypothetical protein
VGVTRFRLCPEHGCKLLPKATQYGTRHNCPAKGCTVACWDGDTSTPADEETRALRHRCHELFDHLWQDGKMSREAAYSWLSRAMGLQRDQAHIGMFDAAQCRTLIEALTGKAVAT